MGSAEVVHYDHAHHSWFDATVQQVFTAELLVGMAKVIDREEDVELLKLEVVKLSKLVNDKMWDKETKFYYDLDREGNHIKVKSIGAFWSIISGLSGDEKLEALVEHIKNKEEFNTKHRVPTLSKDDVNYNPLGEYWRGSVWAPTNYMVIKGLESRGFDKLAHGIALNHVNNVVKVFENTGTLWENYSPENVKQGSISAPNFVGWTGFLPLHYYLKMFLELE